MDVMVNEICGNDSKDESERNITDAPDLPPEYCRYKDDGCELAKSCLNCPFPRCVYDEPRGKQRWRKQIRDREIQRLFDQGTGTRELGVIFGLSRRTIQRAVENTGKSARNRINKSREKERGPDR